MHCFVNIKTIKRSLKKRNDFAWNEAPEKCLHAAYIGGNCVKCAQVASHAGYRNGLYRAGGIYVNAIDDKSPEILAIR